MSPSPQTLRTPTGHRPSIPHAGASTGGRDHSQSASSREAIKGKRTQGKAPSSTPALTEDKGLVWGCRGLSAFQQHFPHLHCELGLETEEERFGPQSCCPGHGWT